MPSPSVVARIAVALALLTSAALFMNACWQAGHLSGWW
jgi:hypothetical protein